MLSRTKDWGQISKRDNAPGLVDGEIVTCVDWSHDATYLVAATNKVRDIKQLRVSLITTKMFHDLIKTKVHV